MTADPFDAIERSDAAADQFARDPQGRGSIGPAVRRTTLGTPVPPQPEIHSPTCRVALAADGVGAVGMNGLAAVRQWPYARRHIGGAGNPDDCLGPGWSYQGVLVIPIAYGSHDYTPSMLWPAGATRDLCTVCRGTHDEEAGR